MNDSVIFCDTTKNIKDDIILKKYDIIKENLLVGHEKINKNAYFLCHGGLGDLLIHSSIIRFLSFFYEKIYLLCPYSCLKNIKIALDDINVEYIIYDKWYCSNQNKNIINADIDTCFHVDESWYITAAEYLSQFYKLYEVFDLFDWDEYIEHYPDLQGITNKEDAWNHWINHGKNEGRTFFKKKQQDESLFNWMKYVTHYSDLQGIINKEDAWNHWINHGKNEGRTFFKKNIVENDIFITSPSFNTNIIPKFISNTVRERFNNFTVNSIISNNKIIKKFNYYFKNDYPNPYYFFINIFYNHIHLDTSIYPNFFYVPSTLSSKECYKKIKNYNIVFLNFLSSSGESFIPENEWYHIYNDEYLIINTNKNHYKKEENLIKYELANQYLNLPLFDYIDIILNATDIYVCDACFPTIIYPLRITNRLNAKNIIFYDRFYPYSCPSIPVPINLSK